MRIFLIIVAMGIATYLPRVLPAFIMDKLYLPSWAQNWLKCIPYAALGALIFPGILFVEKEVPVMGLIGATTAGILAYFRLHIIYVILGSIFSVMLIKSFI